MANKHTEFWLALLNLGKDADHRVRLWNGYLSWKLPPEIKGEIEPRGGWPQLIVDAPDGGWPELTGDDEETIEMLAESHGGHPEFEHGYMDLSGHTFPDKTDFSGLILVLSNFCNVQFEGEVSSDKTRFYGQTFFDDVTFKSTASFCKTRFDAPVSFNRSRFEGGAIFIGVEFEGGASFKNVLFENPVMFNDSRFEERYYSGGVTTPILADFTNAKFMAGRLFVKHFSEMTTVPIREESGPQTNAGPKRNHAIRKYNHRELPGNKARRH